MSWTRLSKKPLFQTQYTKMESWVMQRDTGEEHVYDMTICPDAVIVFARNDDGSIVVLRQFFVSMQGYQYTLAAGAIDEGESPEEAARRELQEEAGVVAKSFHYLGSVSRTKKDTMRLHTFVATGFSEIGEQSLQDDEDIETISMSVEDFKKLLRSGHIEDAPVAHTAFWALDYLNLL